MQIAWALFSLQTKLVDMLYLIWTILASACDGYLLAVFNSGECRVTFSNCYKRNVEIYIFEYDFLFIYNSNSQVLRNMFDSNTS